MSTATASRSRLELAETLARSGDLMSRSVLRPNERFAVLLAGIAALPVPDDELEREYAALVADGCDAALADDVLVQMAAYLGYPRAGRAQRAFRRAGGETRSADASPVHSDAERCRRGIADYARLNPVALQAIRSAFGELAGELIDLTFRSFGDVFATSGQPLAIRQLATVSGLAVLGCAAPQLRFHIGAALRVGVTPRQLVETVMWVQFLAGMPAAYNALGELKRALEDGTEAPPVYR